MYRETLQTFDETGLPDLDVAVLGALELFGDTELPKIDLDRFNRPLVIGSGNAESVGRILFSEKDAVFANESTYRERLQYAKSVDGAVIISASGGKHSVEIARYLKEKGVPLMLFTANPSAPAAEYIGAGNMVVFPKNREPYTYNVSTYMGMLLAKVPEDTRAIMDFIENDTRERIPSGLDVFDAFFLMIPPEYAELSPMLRTKFDELFGGRISGRVFTAEEAKHAKRVIKYDKEFCVNFLLHDLFFEESRRTSLNLGFNEIQLPSEAGPVAMMAIGYYVIGQIQKQHPPYFKKSIEEYVKEASNLFGHEIGQIVE